MLASDIATNCICDILETKRVLSLKSLRFEIDQNGDAPDCLLRVCGRLNELKNYLKDYTHLFIVENGKVALYSAELEEGQENATKYFAEKLKEYDKPVQIANLKIMDGAPNNAKTFIEVFYPDKEFGRFLQLRPFVFTVFPDETVQLVEKLCVKYFKERLKESGEGIRFSYLRGHVAQAPDYIKKYINTKYPGNEFRSLMDNNKDVFRVSNSGSVYLVK